MTRFTAEELHEFADMFRKYGAKRVSEIIGRDLRHVYRKRRTAETVLGEHIWSPHDNSGRKPVKGRLNYNLDDGVIIIFSDAHYWPDEIPIMHKALLKLCRQLKPAYVIANGDVCDFPSISRFAPIGWETRPAVIDELETCQQRMEEVRKASPNAVHIWTAGNHDMRFEAAFAKHVPEMVRVKGLHLKDHFPQWLNCWSVWFNDNIIVKHRVRGGVNAVRNNVLAARRHVITGHLHSANVTPVSAYDNDTLWGMDCGTIADCFGPQFQYIEDNPRDWRSAFGVATVKDGRLLKPELCIKHDETHYDFRGKTVEIK